MESLEIIGGNVLKGTVRISGAKNAALPMMSASLLTEESLVLTNVPYLADIVTMSQLLLHHGIKITLDGTNAVEDFNEIMPSRTVALNGAEVKDFNAPYEIVRKMRASIWSLGPLVGRFGQARVSLPGGCAIGVRQVDQHLKVLEALGANIDIIDGYIESSSNGKKLTGGTFTFEKRSVGATINGILAAVLASGPSKLSNCAIEPEIQDLCKCLIKMGAKIEGIGQETLEIEGVSHLNGTTHSIIPDRIEAGTYMVAAGMSNGEITLENFEIEHVRNVIEPLKLAGLEFIEKDGKLTVKGPDRVQPVDIETEAYPCFPTDMQAQFMALMSVADGKSVITENLFENRFMHIPELNRMGANISINGKTAIVQGVDRLKPAPVMATDLRASVSLVLAGLNAPGSTTINRIYHLDRGYESIEEKLGNLGAQVRRVRAQ